jgi:cyanophycinase
MENWPSRGYGLVRAPHRLKVWSCLLVLASLGTAVVLGLNFAIMAIEPGPSSLAPLERPSGGSLVICGGGVLSEPVRDTFFELAGGRQARIVVVPTANALADAPESARGLDAWKSRGAASVCLLHTRSRTQANDSAFVKPLTEATGVWIGGGKQSWLTDAYLGTEVEKQLKALLDRGGVIGGTSAGAAVMTRVMIANGRNEANVTEGFDFFSGAVVDQHFLKRNRIKRLLSVLSHHPDLVGFGIDEQAAMVVDVKRRHLKVIGGSYVVACVPDNTGNPARFEILKPGDETDLTALRDKVTTVVSALDLDAL